MRGSARYAPLGASALLSALVAVWAWGVLVEPESQVRFAVRETAYVSATFFLCAYLAAFVNALAMRIYLWSRRRAIVGEAAA